MEAAGNLCRTEMKLKKLAQGAWMVSRVVEVNGTSCFGA